jgi:xanthine dehydrogenase accessory factor
MTRTETVLAEAARLSAEGRRYVLATVVSVRRPASTRRGDRALITPDGALIGWVGGACSEPIVVREALRCLSDGEPRLIRIAPSGEREADESDRDVVYATSHCASEGVVEVLVEPQLLKPLLAVIGESPAGRMLGELAQAIGWRVTDKLTQPDAVVVATMGRMDEDILAAALRGGAGYVGLIASARRASSVLAHLRSRGFGEEQLARVRSPAGLDLGPGGQEEIAVAILAELVAWSHMPNALGAAESTRVPPEAVDPVCGMTVAATASAETAIYRGVRFWFCGPGCRAAFEAEPGQYAALKIAANPPDGS